MKGKLILVSAPSGSGKGALIGYLRETMPEIIFPISCTTRQKREGEKDGFVYFFISKEEFDKRIQEGDFLEWAKFGNNSYGTLKSEVLPALAEGKTVVREVDVQGVRQIQRIIPREQLATIFIDAGGWDKLRERVLNRSTMEPAELAARHQRYEEEITFMPEADRVIHNHDGGLEQAKKEFIQAIKDLSQ